MHIFRSFVDSFCWLVMQYKVSPTVSIWTPIERPPIELWKTNANGSPKLPTGVPSHVPYCPIWGHDVTRSMEREKFINARLSKYMELWKQGIEQSVTYVMKMSSYVDY